MARPTTVKKDGLRAGRSGRYGKDMALGVGIQGVKDGLELQPVIEIRISAKEFSAGARL